MGFKKPISFVITLFFITQCTILSGSQKNEDSFSPQSAVLFALTHNPIPHLTQLDMQKAQLVISDIRSRFLLPEFNLSVQSGLVPEARGDIFDSPDKQTDLDGWGPYIKLQLKLMQPLLTFGRRSAAINSAKKGIEIQDLQNQSKVDELILHVLQAYHAVVASNEAVSISEDLKSSFNKLEEEVKKRLLDEDSEVDDTDLLEVQSNRFYIEEILIKSRSQKVTSQQGLNLLLGRQINQSITVKKSKIPKIHISQSDLTRHIGNIISNQRSLITLQKTVQVLEEKRVLIQRSKLPVIYLAGGAGYALAPHREDQVNPFAVDDFNFFYIGAFLGIEWDLTRLSKNIETRKNKLDQKIAENNMVLLKNKIQLDLFKTLTEIRDNESLLAYSNMSLKAAKNWLRLGLENWDLGIGEVERVIKAYNMYYHLQGVVVERELKLNTSLARFAFLLGESRRYFEWIQRGEVSVFQ